MIPDFRQRLGTLSTPWDPELVGFHSDQYSSWDPAAGLPYPSWWPTGNQEHRTACPCPMALQRPLNPFYMAKAAFCRHSTWDGRGCKGDPAGVAGWQGMWEEVTAPSPQRVLSLTRLQSLGKEPTAGEKV